MTEARDIPGQPGKLCSTDKMPMNSGNSAVIFPFHLCRESKWRKFWPYQDNVTSWFKSSLTVHAAENITKAQDASETLGKQTTLASEAHSTSATNSLSGFEMLAQAYISQETGKERVKMIFKKDHMDNYSPELEYIQVVLAQTFVISFFMKYVPEFRVAKQDFIREHHGTVFRTRLEAVRRMQDHISLRAATAGGKFAVKMTAFATSFTFLSQMIASYRNKTSVLEYTVAAGVTGGLARIHLGIKGFLAGSVLGTFLGSLVGCVAYAVLKAHDATQEQRHMHNIISLMEVQQSVEGEHEFKKKLEEVKRARLSESLPAS